MKKLLTIILISFSFIAYCQSPKIILDEKFDNYDFLKYFDYLPINNKVLTIRGLSDGPDKTVYSYDKEGKRETLFDNLNGMSFDISVNEDFTILTKSTKTNKSISHQFIVDGITSQPFNKFENLKFFNKKFQFKFLNEKNDDELDLEKGKVFMERTDIISRKHKSILIEKPDVSKLIGDNLIEQSKGSLKRHTFTEYTLSYQIRQTSNELFEIITKGITKDYKKVITYRNFYNQDGKKTNVVEYDVTLSDMFLCFSNTGGGYVYSKVIHDESSINNFYEDKKTGDVYFYGLISKKKNDRFEGNNPSGYYIFKFDKFGNKVWESINIIEDKKSFNNLINMGEITTNLSIYNDKLLFTTTNLKDDYSHYSMIDLSTGAVLKQNKIIFNASLIKFSAPGIYEVLYAPLSVKELDKKAFDLDCLISIENCSVLSTYIKSISTRQKIYFQTFLSESGIFLLESDHKEYYKLIFFNY